MDIIDDGGKPRVLLSMETYVNYQIFAVILNRLWKYYKFRNPPNGQFKIQQQIDNF